MVVHVTVVSFASVEVMTEYDFPLDRLLHIVPLIRFTVWAFFQLCTSCTKWIACSNCAISPYLVEQFPVSDYDSPVLQIVIVRQVNRFAHHVAKIVIGCAIRTAKIFRNSSAILDFHVRRKFLLATFALHNFIHSFHPFLLRIMDQMFIPPLLVRL